MSTCSICPGSALTLPRSGGRTSRRSTSSPISRCSIAPMPLTSLFISRILGCSTWRGIDCRRVVLRRHVTDVHVPELFGGVAVEPRGGAVRFQKVSRLWVRHPHRLGVIFEQEPKLLIFVFQQVLGRHCSVTSDRGR